jgi:alpha-tubulin suppressor-like RCC1 family protein
MPSLSTIISSCAYLLLLSAAVPAAAQSRFTPRIAAGYSHSVSIVPGGMVATHGENRSGEIGDGTTTRRISPVFLAPPASQTWAQVAVGDFRSTALTAAGEMYSWGSNGYGQLGTGTLTDRPTPTLMAAAPGSTWTGVAAGFGHTVALAANGNLYTWGDNYHGQLGIGSTATTLARQSIASPVAGQYWTQAAAGYNFSLALCSDGSLYAWGSNEDGQLGDGTLMDRLSPVRVVAPTGQTWTQVTGGFWSAAALCSDGSLYTWGNNYSGQLGNGTTVEQLAPVRIAPPTGQRWLQVSVGYSHMLAVCSDGSLYAWGRNNYGQFGNSTNTSRLTPIQVPPPAGKQWVQVSAGHNHSLALASDGEVYAAGYNYSGELGDCTTTNRNYFVRSCTVLATPAAEVVSSIVASPNPFVEEVQLTLSGQVAGPVSLVLYNTLGQCVRRENYPRVSATGNVKLQGLAALPAGVYLLQISTPYQKQLVKLVH